MKRTRRATRALTLLLLLLAAAACGPTLGPPPPAPPGDPIWLARIELQHRPFLVCTRAHESDTSGSYAAVSPSGTYRGAYQFDIPTWNSVASRHYPYLVGVLPEQAEWWEQDAMAWALYEERGTQPWGGRCG